MTQNVGTYDISTLLATRFQSAAQYGLDTIMRVLDADLAAHNAIVAEMMTEMCEVTIDRQRKYGSSVSGDMIETDEYGRAPTQSPTAGATVGFPLKLYQFPIGWTEKYAQVATPADFAQGTRAAETAHLRAIQRELKRAIFGAANYTFNDHLIDKVDLAVKRFVNADGAPIPNGPNGETYDGATHTHYIYSATLTPTALKNVINDVIEHGYGGAVKVAFNRTDETTVRALTGFVPYPDPRIVFRATDTPGVTLDITRLDNHAIGIFEGAEVWIKPWGIANYAFAWDAGSPNKPLGFRQRAQTTLQGLRVAARLSTHPFIADYMEVEFGIGAWTRTNGACLFFNSGSAYASPAIN
jgi:hypothetical protein